MWRTLRNHRSIRHFPESQTQINSLVPEHCVHMAAMRVGDSPKVIPTSQGPSFWSFAVSLDLVKIQRPLQLSISHPLYNTLSVWHIDVYHLSSVAKSWLRKCKNSIWRLAREQYRKVSWRMTNCSRLNVGSRTNEIWCEMRRSKPFPWFNCTRWRRLRRSWRRCCRYWRLRKWEGDFTIRACFVFFSPEHFMIQYRSLNVRRVSTAIAVAVHFSVLIFLWFLFK